MRPGLVQVVLLGISFAQEKIDYGVRRSALQTLFKNVDRFRGLITIDVIKREDTPRILRFGLKPDRGDQL